VGLYGEKVERTEVSPGDRSAKGRSVTPRPFSLPSFTNVVEKLFGNSQARARRLTISLIIAAYTNASALAQSLS
jgi:hypothetical protein